MKTLTTPGLTIAICLSFLSAISQNDFSGIKTSDNFKIIISQSNENSIKIDADDEVKSKIKTEINNGILEISASGKIKSEKPIAISIGIKNLKSVEISGVAEVKSENQLNCDVLNIESSGAGEINLDLKANTIKTKISGAGDIKLRGTAENMETSVSGAGELKAYNFSANKVKAKVSGAGDVKVNVSQMLDADVSGAGSVIYKGNPVDRNVNISGAGSVRQTNDEKTEKPEKKSASVSVDISLNDDDITVHEDTFNSNDPDTTKINFKKIEVWLIEKENSKNKNEVTISNKDEERNKHWAGLYLGVNGFSSPQYSLNLPARASFVDLNYAKSIHFAFNFWEKDIHLHKDYAMFVTGLGVDFNTYALKNNVTLQSDKNSVWGITDTINKFTKNKLKTTFVNVPLLLAFNTNKNPDKAFHIAAGVIFGYNLFTKTKQRFDFAGDEINTKIKNDYNINPFRYSATVQLGYGDFNLYASYAINPLFKGGKGPELYPFTAGIRILGL